MSDMPQGFPTLEEALASSENAEHPPMRKTTEFPAVQGVYLYEGKLTYGDGHWEGYTGLYVAAWHDEENDEWLLWFFGWDGFGRNPPHKPDEFVGGTWYGPLDERAIKRMVEAT